MPKELSTFRWMVSTDWSECISPNGPFDPISFTYPSLTPELSRIFKQYTGNVITLGQASLEIKDLLPEPFTSDQMDAYLEAAFATYTGVPKLIEWCLNHDILFVINTTNSQGYFQRVFAKGLLPEIPLVAANPIIQFPSAADGNRYDHEINEIDDKARATEAIARSLNIPPKNIIVMGDSGGDAAHFQWGSAHGAFIIGSMTKVSLSEYCASHGITINHRFGLAYAPGQERDKAREMEVRFTDLIDVIQTAFELKA
jgi:hypothetical protein